jgi:cell division protein FtsX
MGNITLLMGVFYLLGLIIFAASVLVIFIVTRFEVSVYKDIIHTLYLLGAKDDYICHHFEKRGRKFGFKAGILGSILGTLTCFLFYSFSGGGILWDAAIFIAPLCVLLMVLTPLLCNMICRISSKHYIKILQQKS